MTVRFTGLLFGVLSLFVVAVPKSASAEIVYETLPGEYSFGGSGLGDALYSGFAFRTPPGDTYSIDSVRLNLWNNTNVPNPVYEVEIYNDDAGSPGTLKATVGNGVIDQDTRVMEVAIPATPIELEADTVYWLMANSPGNSPASVSWFYGGEPPTGTFTHIRGPVIWNIISDFLRDADPASQYLHVEVNASLTNAPQPTPQVTLAATFDGAEPSTDGQFTVTASSAAGVGGLTVLFSDLGGTAGSGTDYAPLSGSVVIPEGNTAATIPVSVIDDAVPEATETVIVALSPDAAYTVGSPSMATLNITDDDAVAAIDSADYKVNNAAFFFDVAVSGVPSSITVNLQISTSQNFASPFERFNIRFDSDTGAIDSAVVETISSPPNDRWLDGNVTDLSITSVGQGAWSISGSVPHGADPFIAGDTVSETLMRTSLGDVRLFDVAVTQAAILTYSVSATVAVGAGSVTCNPATVSTGDSSTCTAVPDTGWQVSGWTGACAAAGAGTSETCTLGNIQADQTSTISFEAIPLTIVATVAAGNGTVSCDPASVPPGGSSTCTAVPDTGWQVSGWTGACAAAGAGTSETCALDNIQADQTSGVNFEAASAVVPVEVTPVPTLSKLGLIILGLLMVFTVAIRYRW